MKEWVKRLLKKVDTAVQTYSPSNLLQLKSTNRTSYYDATISLCTSKLPIVVNDEAYETCLFCLVTGNSEVLERYPDEVTARFGHEKYRVALGLNKPKELYEFEFYNVDGK